jgi:hypothetical protein
MGLLRLPTPGFDLQSQLTISQFVIPAGAGATFAASGNIMTITFNAAHGLTLNPSAGVPPNYFITFGGSTSGLTGTGVLVGNIFRILTIPSTTSITIYGTITAATVTSLTGIPIFFPPFTASPGSLYSGPQPTQTVSSVTTSYPPPNLEGAYVYAQLGANCAIRINPKLDAVILDAQTTPSTGTPGTAPTWTDQVAASNNGALVMMPPWSAIWANGSTANSTVSVMN